MTSAAEGRELTQVGPGTVMGELMRQYWIPAAQSSELERDGAPIRLMLLGEKLIAFRDSAGRVGVMDHRCPHRCASLFLGRNEQGGIRCIYHGWKYDVAGNCIDMASVPPQQDFKHKVKAKAYLAVERAGVVWVYMGSAAKAPPLPEFEILDVPDDEISVTFIQRECNYLQAIEGEIDTSHFGFLHAGHVDPDDVPEDDPVYHTITNRAPEYHISRRRLGHAVRRLPRGGRGQHLLAVRQLPVSVLEPGPERRVRQSRACARLGAARRRPHHVLLPALEARRIGADAAAAGLQGRQADRRHRTRQQVPAQHHRLARPLSACRESEQRLGDRPRRPAEQRDLQRDRRHPLAGSGDHREHGADHRPRVRASRAVGSDDHAHAPAPADGGPRAARQEVRCRPASRTPRCSVARAAATSSATTRARGRRSMRGNSAAALHPSSTPLRAAE